MGGSGGPGNEIQLVWAPNQLAVMSELNSGELMMASTKKPQQEHEAMLPTKKKRWKVRGLTENQGIVVEMEGDKGVGKREVVGGEERKRKEEREGRGMVRRGKTRVKGVG
ncbi:hypothetical protein PIB30_011179 [Stylosanthes scabra]|uniref:Uncharacterized protein n=1 Tax=Stylosanthes scabra TaxID=79078 RepID=A0ABU6R6P0_9FABA|nr:hypothetical protein [Stylosanthes scabra]